VTIHDSASTPPQLPDAALDAALRGHRTAGEHPGLDRVADAMNALRRPDATHDHVGHAAAMAAYQERFAGRRASAAGPRRVVLVSSAAGLKLLATAGGSAVALGAVATVLFATSLGPGPGPQTVPVASGSATTAQGKASATDSEDGEGKGPDATGPAAFGLCNAWSNHLAHGTADEKAESSPAFRNLAAAAGGRAKVTQYCAKVPHPGQGKGQGQGRGQGQGNGQGKPDKTAKPTKTAKPEKSPKPSSTARPSSTAKPTLSAPARPSLPSATTTAVPTSTTSTATATATS
jgi:hypothetical protein